MWVMSQAFHCTSPDSQNLSDVLHDTGARQQLFIKVFTLKLALCLAFAEKIWLETSPALGEIRERTASNFSRDNIFISALFLVCYLWYVLSRSYINPNSSLHSYYLMQHNYQSWSPHQTNCSLNQTHTWQHTHAAQTRRGLLTSPLLLLSPHSHKTYGKL